MRRSRLERYEPDWWFHLAAWAKRHGVNDPSDAYEELFMLILEAISSEAAVEMGARGGVKGGKARAAALSPEQRTALARRAAVARWGKI